MADSFASAWALGSIAGELSAQRNAETTQYFVDAMRRRRARQQQAQVVEIDMAALAQHLQEREDYINDLEGEIAELRRTSLLIEANRDKISEWAIRAEKRLNELARDSLARNSPSHGVSRITGETECIEPF